MSVIYLVRMSPCGFSGLPSDMERATLLTPVYMTLQLPRRTALVSPQGRWALTPPSHPYRWNPKAQRRFFSSALLYPRGQLSVRKWDALCCPDFPPAQAAQATDRPTASWGQRYKNFVAWPSIVRMFLAPLLKSCPACPLSFPRPAVSAFMKNETESFD